MIYYHGVSTRQIDNSIPTIQTAGSGIVFVLGTAPIHTVDGKTNIPIMGTTYNEAIQSLGYSDDWKKYSLCEVMYSHYKLYEVSPVIFLNVLDPENHKTTVAAADIDLIEKKISLPFDAIMKTVVVKVETGTGDPYTKGTDYELFYDNDKLILEVLEGGAIPGGATKLNIGYDAVDPSKVTEAEIIGGFDVATKTTSGFELIDKVFPMFKVIPDIIICPGWSHKPAVAAIMNSKADNINGIFKGKALLDVDTTTVTYYADAQTWKQTNNINSKNQLLCYPMCKLGDKVFHMSTQVAGLIAKVDTENNCPYESPSNKPLKIDSTVLEDGTEVAIDLQQANYLNSNGIITALNFVGGFVLWGNECACYPSNTNEQDYFISVSRMFSWVSNSIILMYWSKIDSNIKRRLIDSIIDSLNIWLNGLTSEEKLLGGRVEFKEDENSTSAIAAGKIVFHIYMTPPSPAKEIEFVLEYDSNYVNTALNG
ncbi:phage tail sheath family protein [Vallitalea guaymasensis]|uniref:phage tail sheath family protein n=1 Tax=Vallitalea guaymasensis TaxID=1185412 RepID=UPI000DE20866|nr:phage tail sheath subtilisin-like domain-containing protein [Vallitalea guaymasensis]